MTKDRWLGFKKEDLIAGIGEVLKRGIDLLLQK